MYWTTDLEKTRIIDIPAKKNVMQAMKVLQIMHFLSKSNLIEIKKYHFSWLKAELKKLSIPNA